MAALELEKHLSAAARWKDRRTIPSGRDGRRRLLVIAPHPDDFDAIGVALKRLFLAGNRLEVGVVRTGSGIGPGFEAGPAGNGTAAREREQRASIRFFGLPAKNLAFLDMEKGDDGLYLDSPANRRRIAAFIRSRKPDIIFLPHGNDSNRNHRATRELVRKAAGEHRRPPVLLLNRDPKTIAMRTDAYVAFGAAEAAWKAELLRFHESQQRRNLVTRGHGLDARILAVNRQAARELSLAEEFAETFEIEYPVLPAR